MSVTSRNPVNRVRALLGAADLEPLSDAELLHRFTATRDDNAFAALVRRHTPLVLGTARRVCPVHADAEDVFQATFLTLSRKAGSIRCDGSLAPWLHRVTFRLALRVRRSAKAVPTPAAAKAGDDPLAVLSGRELCSLIDGEIARLSARLRGPIILCCLQGRTRDEAAADLGWSVATLKRRLARAREVLEARLRKKGLSVPAALGPALLAVGPGESTARSFDSAVSPRVAALCAQSGAAKVWAGFIAAAGVATVGLAFGFGQRDTPPPAQPRPVAESRPAETEVLRDPLPTGAVARLGTSYFRHDEWVHDAVWSPDGKAIASTAGPTVIVWDANAGREVARVTLRDEQFPNPAAQKEPPQFSLPPFVGGLEWVADGKGLRTRFNGSTQEWALGEKGLSLVMSAPTRPEDGPATDLGYVPSKLVYNADRKVMAACGPNDDSPKHVEVWDTTPMKRRFRVAFPGGTPADVRAFVLSPDGKWLVTGGGDKTLRWWDTATGKVVREIAPFPIGSVYFNKAAFRPDGKVLLTVSHENHIRLWDVETGDELQHPVGLPWSASALALTPDGKMALVVSERNLCAFDITTGQQRWRVFGHVDAMGRVVVTPDGRTAITSSAGGKVTFWDVATGKLSRQIDNPRASVNHLAISPDGRMLAAIGTERPHDLEIRRWDVESGKALSTLKLPAKPELYSNHGLHFTPDGSGLIVASGTDLFVPVLDVASGAVRQLLGKTDGGINWAEYSADGRTAAATSGSSLFLWESATGKERLTLKDFGYATGFAFSPDGRFIAVANNGSVSRHQAGKVTRMDADRLAVRILDAFTGKEVHRFTGHTGGIRRLLWTSDGRRLVSASADSTCLVWDTSRLMSPSQSLTTAEAEKLWDDLGTASSAEAYKSIGRLAAAPGPAIASAPKHLTAVRPVDTATVAKLVGDLDSPRFVVRDTAAAELTKLGEGAVGQLRKALRGPISAEARERVEKVLGSWGEDDRRLAMGRGLEVLERIGSPEAKKVLADLAAGAEGAWLTDQAKAVVKRLGNR